MLSSTTTTTTTPPPDNHRKATVTEHDPQQPPLKCPRCDSSNTKFCYYNNYSLSQPRYFCKTCRRYWTRGGALRNVPIGGGCRKAKKLKTSNVPPTSNNPADFAFKFLPTTSPAGVYTQNNTQFVTSGSGHGFGLDLFGLNFSNQGASSTSTGGGGCEEEHKISISSIESLSSINQEMHWKLQQQRMALIYHSDNNHDHKEKQHHQQQQQQQQGCINMFQSLEFSGKVEVGPRNWSFEIQPHNYGTNSATATVNHISNNCDINREVDTATTTANFTALQHDQHAVSVGAWTDLHQFNGGV